MFCVFLLHPFVTFNLLCVVNVINLKLEKIFCADRASVPDPF